MRTCPHCRSSCSDADKRCPGCGNDLQGASLRDEDPLIGRVAGRYRIDALIGSGAMSRVYRARMVEGGHEVAVKVLSSEDSADPVLARRFHQEARAMSRLRHENNLSVLDFGQTEDGLLYLVTEVLRGRTLDNILRDEGALEPRRVVTLLAQALDALTEAHGVGVVHRDFKPENIFVERAPGGEERVRVIDYGIAKLRNDGHDPKLTAAGSVCGTPDYMAPEQIRGEEIDGRADLYSAGVVLYEMLTGSRPFSGSLLHVLTMHMHHPPEPPALRRLDRVVPSGLERVCLKALIKERERRYRSATEMRSELLAAMPPSPVMVAAEEAPAEAARMQLPLLGRAAALRQLAGTRRGSVLVVGPGGSGRSRLLEEWRRRLSERGELVISMRPDPSTARSSWRPVRRALAAALGMSERPTVEEIDQAVQHRPSDSIGLREVFGLGGKVAPEERAFRRREALAAAVGILRDTGAAIACEDVDRFDRPSVEVVSALLLDPGTGRVVATATSRGDLPEVPMVELLPLTAADCRGLPFEVSSVGLDPRGAHLPFAIDCAHRATLEGARSGSAGARLQVTPAAARRVLMAVVVGGLEVETALLSQVTGIADLSAPLSLLAGRGLVRMEGNHVLIPSPTLRDALYAAGEAAERTALHRAYAGILATAGVEDEPALCAHHAWAADPEAVTLELLEHSMVVAERAFDDPAAVRWGIRALKRARSPQYANGHETSLRPPSLVPAGLPPRVRCALALGEALLRTGDSAHAEPAFREALAASDGTPLATALARRGLSRVAASRGDTQVAEQELLAGIAQLPPAAVDEEAQVAGEMHLELAALRDGAGRPRDAETALIQGAVRVPAAPEISWRLLLALAERSQTAGRDDDAHKLCGQALRAAEHATPIARARVHVAMAALEERRGDGAAAQRHRDAAVLGLREAGDRLSVAELLLGSPLTPGYDGTAHRTYLAEAGELARQVGWSEGVARARAALRQAG